MTHRKYLIFLLLPFLLAFQCEEDDEPSYSFNTYRVQISPESSFSLTDTIWVEGLVSSKVLDLETNDSITGIDPQTDDFGVFKFINPTEIINCQDAIDQFEVILDIGDYFDIPICENADVLALPELDSDETSFRYRIGFKPLSTGDFVFSFRNAELRNTARNEAIIEDYPITNFPGQIGFQRCERVSWRILSESEGEYYFSVQ